MLDRIPIPNPFGWGGLSTFSLLMMLAFLVGSYILPKELERRKLEPSHSDWLIFLGILGTLIGAKVFFIFEIWDQIFIQVPGYDGRYSYPLLHWEGFPGQPGLWSSLFSGGGLVFYGGLLCGWLFVTLYFKYYKLDMGSYFDAIVPALSMGYAIGRLGCFVSGDGCYGFATDARIPILVFEFHGAHPSGVPVWNTPVMESIIAFGYFAYLQYYARFQNFRKWSLGAQFLMLHGTARLLIEFLRVNKAVIPFLEPPQLVNIPDSSGNPAFLTGYYWHGFSQSQYISIALILAGAIMFFKGKLWQKEETSA
ncbi:prolipoprotein diacylglyceryl transferase [Leptospira ryugenii]|uniref:Phosphatidylglycerol--prolipoprotein diacylglyceryl transferase n=1 Tax=Leptospira ryugenii TaxID=1917863 RepID=A0A2P2DY25_9LEPT|nr:prolipoprotein diacylglyceryl transferase [Leptospira ryugenii]GBF49538.1 prolipoprotein diacylglyceryl transferase [Leptospira ryugenii]